MSRLLIAALAAVLALGACTGGGSGEVTPAALGSTFEGQGIVMPVPEGWTLNESLVQRGIVLAIPDATGSTPTPGDGSTAGQQGPSEQAIIARPDALANLGTSTDQGGFDQMLERIRSGIDQEAVVDRPVDIEGAEQAHQLTYEGVQQQPRQGSTAEPIRTTVTMILAHDGSRYALFQYLAREDLYDESIAALLQAEAALAPGGSTPSPAPAVTPTPAPPPGG